MFEIQIQGPARLTDVRGVTHDVPPGMYVRVGMIAGLDRGDDRDDRDVVWEVSAPYRHRDKKILDM